LITGKGDLAWRMTFSEWFSDLFAHLL
jgi:hypothetical protein